VFPEIQGSKSGALLLGTNATNNTNYLLWGSGTISITASDSLTFWPSSGNSFISARSGYFDSVLVESGPNPMLLSTGDYLFIYNSEEYVLLCLHSLFWR
jgi:predicted GH43/DUF377 family glycosyl hydrolase